MLDWTLPLAAATLPTHLAVERLALGLGWLPPAPEEVAVGPEPNEGASSGGGGPLDDYVAFYQVIGQEASAATEQYRQELLQAQAAGGIDDDRMDSLSKARRRSLSVRTS